jgi:Ceramidase
MPKSIFIKLLIRSCYFTLAMLIVWAFFNNYLTGDFWDGMIVSKSAITVEYCEYNDVSRFFHQSMNTYSNLVYFFFGVLICQIAWEDWKNRRDGLLNRLANFPLLSASMGLCFVYLSFGSAFFHASLTWVGQRVDMNGTYGISIILLTIGLYQVLHKIDLSDSLKNSFIVVLWVLIFSFYKIALMISSSILVPILILILLILIMINYLQFRKKRSIILATLSVVCIVIAIKIRTLDVQKIDCDPHSWYQGHAIWHFLTAISSLCSYSFFRFTLSNERMSE